MDNLREQHEDIIADQWFKSKPTEKPRNPLTLTGKEEIDEFVERGNFKTDPDAKPEPDMAKPNEKDWFKEPDTKN